MVERNLSALGLAPRESPSWTALRPTATVGPPRARCDGGAPSANRARAAAVSPCLAFEASRGSDPEGFARSG